MKCEDYCKLRCLLVITTLVLKLVKRLKRQVHDEGNATILNITSNEIAKSERLWIIEFQGALVERSNFKLWKRQLGLFCDKMGIWRCGCRLERMNLFTHYVWISNIHWHIWLKDCHEDVMHNGVKETLTHLWSKYWIIRGRSLVRKLLHGCVVCHKVEGKPF